ncbi:CocE/NonD family hydrolase [Steroidobacter sp.]|uniref:CocE/NonD family hydrolase n=1 Tax=Steroidobacter sp. TaxID=1978227 RepID=UPI001A495066|nr:CocE/NonD family hydrolase [Steroidobacter sp.]MBL8272153.1 CocE/NonD family hydrolase [Steroidobacter sp.]
MKVSIQRAFGIAFAGVVLGLGAITARAASEPASVDRNVFIPMRDGIRLATDLYMPAAQERVRLPTVLIRTPYNKSFRTPAKVTSLELIEYFTERGYVVAVQDKRGRFASEGVYVLSGGDADDGYDTVDWLVRQPWSNGAVGSYGCSYVGDTQIFMAQTKHPGLKAMIPQAAGSSVGSLGGYYRYFGARTGGVSGWAPLMGWFAERGQKTMPRLSADLPHDEYNANAAMWKFTREVTVDLRRAWHHLPMIEALRSQGMATTDFEDTISKPATDPYWASLPYMKEDYTSDVPTLFINSWYDFGADMTMLQFNHFRQHSVSQRSRDNQYVIMSPHTHCTFEREAAEHTLVGQREVGDTRFDYRDAYLTWFDAWLKEDPKAQRRIKEWSRIRYFEVGRNKWRSASEWPVRGVADQSYFLDGDGRANGLLGDGKLARAVPTGAVTSDTFVYDPSNPVPSLGGSFCASCVGLPDSPAGAVDQRAVEMRGDVLVYTSDVLTKELNVTGEPRVVLHVSSDVVDTDFTVKLIDVQPDGRAFNVLDGILRARYRQGQHQEVWMRAGQTYELTIPLGATSNVFLKGHRIRLEIASSNFPTYERNLNLGGVNVAQTTWAVARNTVHHSPTLRSRLILPVLQ